MLVFHGTRLYGKVDEVPGLFYVATLFFHVQFIPVLPRRSLLVMGKQRAFALPLNGKSMLIAWLRVGFVLGCIGFAFAALQSVGGHEQHLFPYLLGLSIACACLMWLSYPLTRAKPVRALQLAAQAGIPPEVVAGYFANRLSEMELEDLAQKARAAEDPMLDQYAAGDTQPS
jgi:hypothetical protein